MKKTEKLPYWNHNTAYFPWIKEQIPVGSLVLDVGCGDGALAAFLTDRAERVDAIDPFPRCIETATAHYGHLSQLHFAEAAFETFSAEPETYDAVTFVASLHHMAQREAVEKAKTLLKPGGKLLIVGLAASSRLTDYLREIGRVIPATIGSKLHRMRTTEELGVPTAYAFPKMDEIRTLAAQLPNAKLSHGLYYRYLLSWQKL